MDAAKKNFRRFQQLANQNLGLAEKTQVITDDLHSIEERAEHMVDALTHTRQKLAECLRSRSKEENLDKRRKKLVEFQLAQTFLNDAKNLEDVLKDSLLSQVLSIYGNGLLNVSEELVQSELNIERRIFEHLLRYSEESKNVSQQKEKMKKAVLDMDSVRSRLANAQNKGEKYEHLQDELDLCWNKVENYKDTWALELYTLAGKEIDMANIYFIMAKLQMDYYKTAYKTLEDILPLIQIKIDQYPRRPVYGCPLADHLRYSRRDVSVVLEVCCSALCELGLKEEGLFRISGSATKIKKLKAAFDVDEIDLTDMEGHPHSIAGALKLYLRELPDPLMTHNLYGDWLKVSGIEDTELRLKSIKDVINQLPEANFVNLCYLIRFLCKVAENQHYTKMNSQNLAIVIAPNILWSPNTNSGFSDNLALGTLVDCLISNADYFFPGEIKFQSSRIASLINKTGGFMDDSFCGNTATLTGNTVTAKSTSSNNNIMEESCRSISPPSDDSSSLGGSFNVSMPNQSNVMKTSLTASQSQSKRPKQPAPPPPKASAPPATAAKPQAVAYKDRGPEVICATMDHEYSAVPLETMLPLQKSPKTPPDDPVVVKSSISLPANHNHRQIVYSSGNNGTPQKQSPLKDEQATGKSPSHRKTNSLDRPVRPPRGSGELAVLDGSVTVSAGGTNNNAIGNICSLERPPKNGKTRSAEYQQSHVIDNGSKISQSGNGSTNTASSSLPHRPPLPSKEKVAVDKQQQQQQQHSTSLPPQAARKNSATTATMMIVSGHAGATNFEIEPNENYDDVCEIDGSSVIRDRRASGNGCENDMDESDLEKQSHHLGGGARKAPLVTFRRNAFEKIDNNADGGSTNVKREPGSVGQLGPTPNVAPRMSMKMMTSLLDDNTFAAAANGASAVPAPPRPKPPLPSKPRSGYEENNGGAGTQSENSTRL